MNRTDAVVSIVSNVAFANVLIVMDRYRTRPRKRDQITAATVASVGVKRPNVMPPIRITGAIRAMTAEKSKNQSSAIRTARPIPMAKCCRKTRPHHQPDRNRKRQYDCNFQRRAAQLRPREGAVAAPSVFVREERDRPHHQERHDKAWKIPPRNNAPIETFAIMP